MKNPYTVKITTTIIIIIIRRRRRTTTTITTTNNRSKRIYYSLGLCYPNRWKNKEHNRPDLVVKDYKRKTCLLIDMSEPTDNISVKEYDEEIQRLGNKTLLSKLIEK